MKVQIFSFALLALLVTAYAVTECPEVDSEEAVSVVNPANCSTYFQCQDGEQVLMECPPGLKYNQELGVCDWPEDANCVETADAEAAAEK